MRVSVSQAATRSFSDSTVSMSTLINDIGLKVGRILTGEEIAKVVNEYGPGIQSNYFKKEGPSNCTFDMF
jgi:hypothetical protein